MIPRQPVFSSHSSFQAAGSASKLAEKWHIPILFSLVWPDRGSNPHFKYRNRGSNPHFKYCNRGSNPHFKYRNLVVHANHYTNKAERKMNKYMFILISWLYINIKGGLVWFYGFMVFYATFTGNNILVISWWSILLVE